MGRQKFKTQVAHNTLSPCWNESFDLTVSDIVSDPKMQITVFDHDMIKSDVMGKVEISLKKTIELGGMEPTWFDLQQPKPVDEEDLHDEAETEGGGALFANAFQVRTVEGGYNMGRKYFFQCNSSGETQLCITMLNTLSKVAKKRNDKRSKWTRRRDRVQQMRQHPTFQRVSVTISIINFAATIMEAQLMDELTNDDGSNTRTGDTFGVINILFVVAFLLEFAVTVFATWWRNFAKDAFNWFDAVIVISSALALGPLNFIPGSIIRAMRVFGLFGRAKSLRRIISPLLTSVVPVLNAFVIMMVLVSFYSIVGVSLFREQSTYMFGSFTRAFCVMFRVVGGETWLGDPVTGDLPIIPGDSDSDLVSPVPVIFVFSFMLFVNWVLLQVTVAVLLDNFIQAGAREEKEAWSDNINEWQNLHNIQNPLDPLLKKLITGYVDEADLVVKLETLFKRLDESDDG